MGRVLKGEGRRDRILADNEICAIWKAPGQYGDFVRLGLLTGQRREKLATMRWDDIQDGIWNIRTEAREKGNAGRLKLPQVALDIIARQPRFASNASVFAGRDSGPTTVFYDGRHKARFDERCGVKNWTIHDLRRSARSLMSRAGVLSDHAERVLGHAIGGVEGIYNRHGYDAEKAEALEKLAGLIEQIVT
jgi:integrase